MGTYSRVGYFVLASSWLAFIAALCMPVFYIDSFEVKELYGMNFVSVGVFECFFWLANPLLLLATACIKTRRNEMAVIASGIAGFIAGTSFFRKTVIIDEAGAVAKIDGYGLGFYLWVAAFVLSFIASCILCFALNNGRPQPEKDGVCSKN